MGQAAVRARRWGVPRALLAAAAAAAVAAAGCASHLARPAPVPAAAVAGRCGVQPGVCLLGVPAPLDEGGEASGWRCLGLHGGTDAACALPAAARPTSAERAATRPGTAVPAAAPRVVGSEPARGPATAGRGRARQARSAPRTEAGIAALLAAKARRTPAQRKVSSRLLDAAGRARQGAAGGGLALTPGGPAVDERVQTSPGPVVAGSAADGRVVVDIRAEVTPEVLARIETLGGAVVDSVPRYRSIRARLPLAAVEPLAALEVVRSVQPADVGATWAQASAPAAPALRRESAPRAGALRADLADTRDAAGPRARVNTSEGDVAHRADAARRTYGVDGAGIGIGVLSNGVDTLAARQASGDLPGQVTVLSGQAGSGDEGTALLEVVHDLAPGAELYYATAFGGQARFAANIEALCAAGADIIVDDIYYPREAAFQDGVVAQGINAAAARGCFHFSSAGNNGNLNDGTSGVWEGDFAAARPLLVNGATAGVRHDFGGGLEENRVVEDGRGFVLQWADPLGASANDYDLFLVDAAGEVLASSTTTQDGTQDPVEYVHSDLDHGDARLVVVKVTGAERYLRLGVFRGELAVATAGNAYGHMAAANAIGVTAVDARTAGGAGGVFDGTERVGVFVSDGPRRIFFQPNGTPITEGDYSSTGGQVLQKPDLAAADAVSTATPQFALFEGTSAAAPHAAAIAALILEAAGGPDRMTLPELRAAMTASTVDIEAEGVDRDSGAGIVMAPAAVSAAADRNTVPTVVGAVADRTLAVGGGAVTVDVAGLFVDADDDLLIYSVLSSDPDRVAATLAGTSVTLTPLAPGSVVVAVTATDAGGSNTTVTQSFGVTVWTANGVDYDIDDDGLVEIATLAQLDAVRHDLDGDARPTFDGSAAWFAAFADGAEGLGCRSRGGCTGYELAADLDFDTNGDGVADAGDAYWNGGAGWAPLGDPVTPFTGTFEGNGRTLRHLFVFTDELNRDAGLFGTVGGGVIRRVGLVDVDVSGGGRVGGLAASNQGGEIGASHVTGRVSGHALVGGLVGDNGFLGAITGSRSTARVSGFSTVGGLVGTNRYRATVAGSHATGRVSAVSAVVGGLAGHNVGEIRTSYATGRVSGGDDKAGGLVGNNEYEGTITASYATGGVSGRDRVGGLTGRNGGKIRFSYATGRVTATGESGGVGGLVGDNTDDWFGDIGQVTTSYWDTSTSGHTAGDFGNGQSTTALQAPTGYSGIYQAWNIDLDGDGAADSPWHFGTDAQYPALALDMDGDGQATWQEFGHQFREGPALTATAPATGVPVELIWTAVDASHWSPAPPVTYAVYRTEDDAVELIANAVDGLSYTDSGVEPDASYAYQVAALVADGEATRSALVTVRTPPPNRGPEAVGALSAVTLPIADGCGGSGRVGCVPGSGRRPVDVRGGVVGAGRGDGEDVDRRARALVGGGNAVGGGRDDGDGDGDRRGRLTGDSDAVFHGDGGEPFPGGGRRAFGGDLAHRGRCGGSGRVRCVPGSGRRPVDVCGGVVGAGRGDGGDGADRRRLGHRGRAVGLDGGGDAAGGGRGDHHGDGDRRGRLGGDGDAVVQGHGA